MSTDEPVLEDDAQPVPWLSVFAGGFWAGLEPMFLLTFLIATLGALCFMCVATWPRCLLHPPVASLLASLPAAYRLLSFPAAWCWACCQRRRLTASSVSACPLAEQRSAGLDPRPRCRGGGAGQD
jgi:hypothetical protein